MRVLILGGGEVGTLVARRLIREKSEVVIVESGEERCHWLEESLDAKVVQGQASSVKTLERAGIQDAEMLIAVTSSDEANLLGCLIARARSNVKIKVARLRTHEVDLWRAMTGKDLLDIDLVIHPDRETAEGVMRVVGLPGVSDILEFAQGRIKIFGMTIPADSWVVGKTMSELDQAGPPPNSLIAILFRGRKAIIPRGSDVLRPGDHVYIVVPTEELQQCFDFMGVRKPKKVERVFIVGGKQLGIEIAIQLEGQGVQVKLFERDLKRCQKIATLVERTVVVHDDGTAQATLLSEHIEGIDAFLALTGHDEDNIIASLLAKRLGARKAIALINRLDFLPIGQLLGINSAFSTRLAVVDRILQFVRKGKVFSVKTFREEEAEAIELMATQGSKYVGRKLRDVHFPHGAIVGAIARPSGQVVVPRGDVTIEPGDRVLFFCLEYLVPQLESAYIAGR